MNVHFFITFAKDANDSPFAQELNKQSINCRIFSDLVSLRYSRRVWLYLIGWPRMMLFGFRQSVRSLFTEPRPDWVVAQSHFDILAMSIVSLLLFRKRPKLMLLGFIYTRRQQQWIAKIKRCYFSIIVGLAHRVVCHSVLEVEDNRRFFNSPDSKFIFIPYGLHVYAPRSSAQLQPDSEPYALSAGRSGRDYALLGRVFAELGYPLRIVCDSDQAVKEVESAENIRILNSCYGEDYLKQLAAAKLVIVPIAVDDISAGQMVFLQAMALRKPVIITDTPTTRLYAEHGKTALLVEKGSFTELKLAVEAVWGDVELAARLAETGYRHFAISIPWLFSSKIFATY